MEVAGDMRRRVINAARSTSRVLVCGLVGVDCDTLFMNDTPRNSSADSARSGLSACSPRGANLRANSSPQLCVSLALRARRRGAAFPHRRPAGFFTRQGPLVGDCRQLRTQ